MKNLNNVSYYIKTVLISTIWIFGLVAVSLLKYSNFDISILLTFPVAQSFLVEQVYLWMVAILVIDIAINDICSSNKKMNSGLWLLIALVIISLFIAKLDFDGLFWIWIIMFLVVKTVILLKQNCMKKG
ncbi:hypothetical protein SPONL_38 [uncultured Candidatus Thioglobus sp.]|nr:hypothetical protein SPONL_38 [uncultured Candidatus Thioglobus sp.]